MKLPFTAKNEKDFVDTLYRKFYKLAAYQIFQIVKESAVVADILQDSFVRLIPKIDLLRTLSENQLRVYISQTAKHTALDYMRKKHVRDKWTYYAEETAQIPADDFETPEDVCIRHERMEELNCAMACLPERDRDMLYFHYRLEITPKEICNALGIRIVSYYQLLSRARKRLCEIVKREDWLK